MVYIAEASIYFPLKCRVEHRRVGQRFVVFLPRGDVHCETGKNSRTFSYTLDVGDDGDAELDRTERRARLMAAALGMLTRHDAPHGGVLRTRNSNAAKSASVSSCP